MLPFCFAHYSETYAMLGIIADAFCECHFFVNFSDSKRSRSHRIYEADTKVGKTTVKGEEWNSVGFLKMISVCNLSHWFSDDDCEASTSDYHERSSNSPAPQSADHSAVGIRLFCSSVLEPNVHFRAPLTLFSKGWHLWKTTSQWCCQGAKLNPTKHSTRPYPRLANSTSQLMSRYL